MSSVNTNKKPSNAYKDGTMNLRVLIFLTEILNIITVFIFAMKILKKKRLSNLPVRKIYPKFPFSAKNLPRS